MSSRTSTYLRFVQPVLLLAAGVLLGALLSRSLAHEPRSRSPVNLAAKRPACPSHAPALRPIAAQREEPASSSCDASIPLLQCFTGAYLIQEAEYNSLYSQDAQVISKTLARYLGALTWKGDEVEWYAIDIGANSGQTAVEMASAFTLLSCRKLALEGGFEKPPDCNDALNHISYLFSIEPMPTTYETLKAAGNAMHWGNAGWMPYRYAVSDVSNPNAVIYGATAAGNEQPSLDKAASKQDGDGGIPVETITLVDFLDRHHGAWRKPTSRCFLLKVDAEGYDPKILLSSAALLEGGHSKFVLFEYNGKWRDADREMRLQTVVAFMESHHYSCAYVTRELLLPITMAHWSDLQFELFLLSNVLCGYDTDPDWLSLRRAFSRPHRIVDHPEVVKRFEQSCTNGVSAATSPRAALTDFAHTWAAYLDCLGW